MLDMAVPADRIHLEDVEVGRQIAFGHYEVTKEDIVTYAEAFDPQPIHLDEEAAKRSIVGGLCASGFHSCAMLMRMLADDFLEHGTSLGSPGIDEVRWMRPVRPGDVLSARFVCPEKRALASRPGVGLAKMLIEMLNQKGEVVMSWDSNQLLRVRHPAAPSDGERNGGEAKPRFQSLWEMPGPAPDRSTNYFEDRQIGETYSLGSHTFTHDDVIDFARRFDPQAFHLDDAAAAQSLFGRLSASGWHTTAIWIRQFVRFRQEIERDMRARNLRPAEYGPSPGFQRLRWLKPVYPGDTIEFRGRVDDKLDWRSRPDRGLIETENQGRNQHGEVVFGIRGRILAEKRNPG
ncbi:MAG: MaoC family dehydratase [Hyphomicrobiaceae bacterium]|nr:MaoC family dehydratase [Hyphomicrobiaceae bacterium]